MSPQRTSSFSEQLSQIQKQIHQMQQDHLKFRRLIFRSIGGVVACLVLFLTTSHLIAAEPPIVYSGYLEEGGVGFTDSRKAEFSLWTNGTSTNATTHRKCLQAISALQFAKGRFKIKLDAACAKTVYENVTLWVELTVWNKSGTSSTTLQRTQFASIPNAIRNVITIGSFSSTGVGTFCGMSAQTTGHFKATKGTTSFDGYQAAKVLCEQACKSNTAHMCSGHELSISLQLGRVPTALGWYSGAHRGTGTFNGSSNCNGWETSNQSSQGNYFNPNSDSAGRRYMSITECNTSRNIICCK